MSGIKPMRRRLAPFALPPFALRRPRSGRLEGRVILSKAKDLFNINQILRFAQDDTPFETAATRPPQGERRQGKRQHSGFTLLEILIALFIFTILSMILATALRSVIDALAGTEVNAARLRKLQMTLLIMSRDMEQAVNRPVFNSSGKLDRAFVGTRQELTFTHMGFSNPNATFVQSNMQRTRYILNDNKLLRITWPVLDQGPMTKQQVRTLLDNVLAARFQYLDSQGRFHNDWPAEVEGSESLPRAVRVHITIKHWGKISQLYVIPAQMGKNAQQIPPSTAAKS